MRNSIGKTAMAISVAAGISAVAEGEEPNHHLMEGTVMIGGLPSGSYREETTIGPNNVQDEVDQLFIFNRGGSRVELSSKNSYEENSDGLIESGHSETSSSKSTVVVDYAVRDGKLSLVTNSGGRSYSSEIPLSVPLVGPAGVRKMMNGANAGAPHIQYATYFAALGQVTQAGLDFAGTESLKINGTLVSARKFAQSVQGMPGKSTVWVDVQGYTLQTQTDSPFGQIVIVPGKPATAVGAELAPSLFDSALAVSNIRLPHPRMLQAVTVEITKKQGAADGWADLSWANQRVLENSPDRLVLEITQLPTNGAPAAAAIGDTAPNAIVQSDDPKIIALAKDIVGRERDPWKKALLLQTWTAANMQFDMGIAIAPASELVRDKHGTCLGYSILLASLARAEGIPARIRMGFVYDAGIWGGHAWDEFLIDGKWIPVDAAEYRRGITDAARIGIVTVGGENGAIDPGPLGQFFGQVEIKTLAYRLDGQAVSVPASINDHSIEGDTYENPWIGLTVHKPNWVEFANADDHWPNRNVLDLKSTAGTVHIAYVRANDSPLEKQIADRYELASSAKHVTWSGKPAIRFNAPGKAVMAVAKDDVVWAVVAEGNDAPALLDRTLSAISIRELAY